MKTCNDAPVGYTDHPPVGQWVEWYGGDCPVHPLATVDYQMRNGERCVDKAGQLDWSIQGNEWDVVRFCILEEYKAPVDRVAREVWVMTDEAGYDYFCADGDYGATLFREVLQ